MSLVRWVLRIRCEDGLISRGFGVRLNQIQDLFRDLTVVDLYLRVELPKAGTKRRQAARWEEIDRGTADADYGWNLCEGRHDNPYHSGSVDCSGESRTPPIHEYSHDTGYTSITGGAFVPNDGSWPNSYDSAYLFADFVCDKIFLLKPKSGGGFARILFATDPGAGGRVAMAFGPYGSSGTALYYTTFADDGKVHRIIYSGS